MIGSVLLLALIAVVLVLELVMVAMVTVAVWQDGHRWQAAGIGALGVTLVATLAAVETR